MNTLALFGGTPALTQPLTPYRSTGKEEEEAVIRTMRSGTLSGFFGSWGEEFHGGPEVRAFEKAWAHRFTCKHAITVNSNTSGLIAAMGAIGTSPGDEIIVPPFSMSATVMAPLIYGGIPVFVDLEPETFCLDPDKVRAAITPKTRAILAVNMFGHPAALHELRSLADEKGIYLIEDAAQSPLAMENGRYAGTIGHIGIFSLNYHKHIHTGEGGVCCTNDDDLAKRLCAIRNHGENVVEPMGIRDITNMVGFNFRLTELQAAIGIEQLKKIDALVDAREAIAHRLSEATHNLPGLAPPVVRAGCRHVHYVWMARYNATQTGVPRKDVIAALNAEGVPAYEGYLEPLYMLPVFQRRHAIGRDGWPFTLSDRAYAPGLCPIAERLQHNEIIAFAVCSYQLNLSEQDSVIAGFEKVFTNLNALRNR
ncbi:MAG: DegT/DnrJ/EryC1/StrS family aminotransferase [Rhodospirillaceae bacterium]|nr:DegT/DnrJ/EryC1/StrS family aminotransferase [Rhodospirillaceae bacterium]